MTNNENSIPFLLLLAEEIEGEIECGTKITKVNEETTDDE